MSSNSESQLALLPQPMPATLEASWVGSLARSRLDTSTGGGTVHGVFDGAINVLLEAGLVSLVPDSVERGPLNVNLRLPPSFQTLASLGLRAGDAARVRGSTLELGNRLRISSRSARIYAPRRKFTLPLLEDAEISANVLVARDTALLFGNMEGLGQLLALVLPEDVGRAARDLNVFASAALGRIMRLEDAYLSEDARLLEEVVSELIGLGPGLTPSSDDMLAGLVLQCVLCSANRGGAQRASRLIAQAAAKARGRTTLLSEEYLEQAALGRGNETIMRLCAALLTEGRASVERETRRVVAIGETSGTDAVLGVLLGTVLSTATHTGLARRGL